MRYLMLLLGIWGIVSYYRSQRRPDAPTALLPSPRTPQPHREQVTYRIVEHDGGWAYMLGDVYSETYPTRRGAFLAAEAAGQAHQQGGDAARIEYQDEDGFWHHEIEAGDDRPQVVVASDTQSQAKVMNP